MKATMKLLGALALAAVLAGCAGFSFQTPDDPPIYHDAVSD